MISICLSRPARVEYISVGATIGRPPCCGFGWPRRGTSADAQTLSPAYAGAPPKGEPFGCVEAHIFRRGDHWSPALLRVQTAAKNPSRQQQRQRLPCVKGAAPQGLRDCRPQPCAIPAYTACRRQSLRLAWRRSTSLCTREAFGHRFLAAMRGKRQQWRSFINTEPFRFQNCKPFPEPVDNPPGNMV